DEPAHILMQHFNSDGTASGPVVDTGLIHDFVSETTANSMGVEFLPDGGWIILYNSYPSHAAFQRFHSDGTLNGEPIFTSSSVGAYWSEFIVLPDGGWVVALNTSVGVVLERYDADGNLVGEPTRIDDGQ